jgi:hypothetical protein
MTHQMTIKQAESDFSQIQEVQNSQVKVARESQSQITNLLHGVSQILKKFAFNLESNNQVSSSADAYLLQQSLKNIARR